ncbi:SDR family NAD(P)-dependent oxidoreductase [Actinoplanes sp. NPDC049316]|uniref:SDR family NAD(P)-dependent oxidoreductase n=1 Tax=Actinoplanes sp. NPDC049316 TaxID=3154727 RepID=UPI003437D1D6
MSDRPATRTALITGASSGIGQATADAFAQAGWRVFGTSRRPRPHRPGVHMLQLDVRSDQAVIACVSDVIAESGCIGVLVNNARMMHTGMAEETTMEQARGVFETNLFGVARLTNAALPHMRARRHGRIINIGSAAGWIGEPGEAGRQHHRRQHLRRVDDFRGGCGVPSGFGVCRSSNGGTPAHRHDGDHDSGPGRWSDPS